MLSDQARSQSQSSVPSVLSVDIVRPFPAGAVKPVLSEVEGPVLSEAEGLFPQPPVDDTDSIVQNAETREGEEKTHEEEKENHPGINQPLHTTKQGQSKFS